MSKFGPSANGPAFSTPKGSIGSSTARIPEIVQRRSGVARGFTSQLHPPLAAPLGVRRILFGRARRAQARARFPPRDQAIVKAIACEAVCQTKLPLSRLSTTDLAARAATALGQQISPTTVWRILDADAIKPWRYEYWIFPRDPQFAEKAGRLMDLYAGVWEGKPLGPRDYIISSDEKTSIQARIRRHKTLPADPETPHARRERVQARWGFAVLGCLGCSTRACHGPV